MPCVGGTEKPHHRPSVRPLAEDHHEMFRRNDNGSCKGFQQHVAHLLRFRVSARGRPAGEQTQFHRRYRQPQRLCQFCRRQRRRKLRKYDGLCVAAQQRPPAVCDSFRPAVVETKGVCGFLRLRPQEKHPHPRKGLSGDVQNLVPQLKFRNNSAKRGQGRSNYRVFYELVDGTPPHI